MPVDKNIRTYGAGNHFRKKGLKGGAGGDVRGVNQLTATASNSEHTYSSGRWAQAATDSEAAYYPPLGQTYNGPPMWVSGGRYRRGDKVVAYVSGVPREYKAIVNIPAVNAVDAAAATTDSNTAGDVAPTTATACWDRVDDTYGLTRSQGGLNPGVPTSVAVAGGTTGTVSVTWTQGKPNATCTYELVALRPDLYWDIANDAPGSERLTSWILQNDVNDSVELAGLTLNGDDYPIAGSGWVVTTAAANSTGSSNWDVTKVVASGYEVVIGVRVVAEADTTGATRQNLGRRGPWAWAVGTAG
jgi:hypothetical protein